MIYLTKHYEYSSFTKTKLESRCFRGAGSHTNCLLYDSEPLNDSAHTTRVDEKIVTRTEAQQSIPLVLFLTGVLKTFGFWLDLPVSESATFVKHL